MNALQSSLMSALMLASAGEFAAISMIASGAGFMEMIITTVVINMRYLLMSSALSQKVQQNRPFLHRIFMSYAVTDEIFGISMVVPPARKDKIIAAVVVVSMAVSFLFQSLPGLKNISSGFQIILLTVLISAAAAVLFPVKEEQHES